MLRAGTWLGIGTAALLLFLSSVSADDVVVLSEDNFEKEVGQDRGALVEFYAPWYLRSYLSPLLTNVGRKWKIEIVCLCIILWLFLLFLFFVWGYLAESKILAILFIIIFFLGNQTVMIAFMRWSVTTTYLLTSLGWRSLFLFELGNLDLVEELIKLNKKLEKEKRLFILMNLDPFVNVMSWVCTIIWCEIRCWMSGSVVKIFHGNLVVDRDRLSLVGW